MNPERWLVLTAHVGSPELRDLAAAELIALGGSAVVEEAGAVSTYVAPPGDPTALLAAAKECLSAALPGQQDVRLTWRWQDNEDWALDWKRGLQPRKVTDRLVVKPTWTEWEGSGGEIVIDIDPQMAFGTGEHATTRGCLRLLDSAIRPGDRVLDVGSGSAILAIAAALLGAEAVTAVEYDPDANLNAWENLDRNGVANRVVIVEQLADPPLLEELGTFDVVVANILSSVIRPLLPAFRRSLMGDGDGRLIVSGILRAERDEVVAAGEAAGFRVSREDAEEEWWSALLLPDA